MEKLPIQVIEYSEVTKKLTFPQRSMGSPFTRFAHATTEFVKTLILDSTEGLKPGVNFINFWDTEWVLDLKENSFIYTETNTITGNFDFYIL